MIILGIILIVIGLPLLVVPIIGVPLIIFGIIMIFSSIGSGNAEKTAQAIVKTQANSNHSTSDAIQQAEHEKWVALVKYDDEIAAAHKELEPLGENAIRQLKTVYLSLNDKTKLDKIVLDIKQQFST